MAVFRYKAVAIPKRTNSGGSSANDAGIGGVGGIGGVQTGMMAGESAAEVRASLRRIGLQVLDIKARRSSNWQSSHTMISAFNIRWKRHLRARRQMQVSELYDALATMLESGMPLLEALRTIERAADKGGRSRRSFRTILTQMRDEVHGGSSLAAVMATNDGMAWFDPVDIAMVRAGQHAGDLSDVLRRLAERYERSASLQQKLLGALTYPAIVACIGIGVVMFLSMKTLPDLVSILETAEIDPPKLTEGVIGVGELLVQYWWILAIVLFALPLVLIGLRRFVASNDRISTFIRTIIDRLTPSVYRRIALANVAQRLAELTRTGVPMVEAIRIIAPTSPRALRKNLIDAATAVERGQDLPTALEDEQWFDAEFKQLLAIGQTTGELDELLERIAARYTRQSERLINRLAALLEPAVIIVLAAMIGVVVMAAILPLVKLQEVL